MKAQIYQTPDGWTAKAIMFGGPTFCCGSYPTRQDALDELAETLWTHYRVEIDEIEVIDAPVLPPSVLGRDDEWQLRLW